ncbi:GNAT family N-acetyltransferase [Ferrimonas balearica]|uniref:GNAT family N-acetyltransferase n=1 Tax=Ferrimonas balearica TaxID=44012 RepID=UPI001C99EDBD|nr:GNAT family N-acetyltransferase [Ferrimonas balearica]MBY5992955.1 GNAT family N-acetyltransferase [Ferrimonas balearica]
MASKRDSDAKWFWMAFDELDGHRLYALLRLREQVFMLEQNSLYEDLDDQDQAAAHLLVEQGGELVGYLRLLHVQAGPLKLGRIVLSPSVRGSGLGPTLIQAGIDEAHQRFPGRPIKISAQLALKDYYQRFGFAVCSEPYDDGGVLHLDMVLESP